MDGRGRAQDNIFIERLWWTLKYQYLYLWSFNTVTEPLLTLSYWFSVYNAVRSHYPLANLTLFEVYFDLPHLFANSS